MENVLFRIAQLPKLPATELKALWRELFSSPIPFFRRTLLEERIAYRLQELAFGGLTDKTLAKLNKLKQETNKFCKPATLPPAGTVLIREFKGIEHRVQVLADGFEYQGLKFRSLSAIACKVTGCNWNGLKFFGLKR